MEIVDSQVHANQRGIDQSIAIMDAVGVDAAVIDIWPPVRRKLPNGVTRFEYTFAEEAVARFPARFAYIARFDPNDPEIDDLMAQVRKAPGRICTRIASGFDFKIMREGGHERILAAAGKHGVPVMIYPGGEYLALTNYVRKFDSVQFIIDHVGMGVERAAPARPVGGNYRPASSLCKISQRGGQMGTCPPALARTISVPRPDLPTTAGYRRFRRQAPDVGERLHGNR